MKEEPTRSVREMLERDIFIKQELTSMFAYAHKKLTALVVVCTVIIIAVLISYRMFSSSQDMVTLRKVEEQRAMLQQDRKDIEGSIDSLHVLIKNLNAKMKP